MKKIRIRSLIASCCVLVFGYVQAATISVNFHVENDADAQDDHELTGSEAAGLDNNTTWNNINVGNGGAHNNSGIIFSPTVLTDDAGDTNAATIATSEASTWFVGYCASAALEATELGLEGNHDDLFNSYLALGSSDVAVLQVTGISSNYTSGGYRVIIYSDTDKRPASGANAVRQSLFTLTPADGSALTALTEDDVGTEWANTFDGTYILSDNVDTGPDYSNYTIFEGLSASSFTLGISSPDGGRGGISGFQIVSGSDAPAPLINSFSADTLVVETNGTPVTLAWDVSGASALSITPEIGDVLPVTIEGVGQTNIVLSAAATFTLTASNAMGMVSWDLKFHLATKQPNVLLVLVDDYGVTDTSVPFAYDVYNNTGTPLQTAFNNFYHTPNMERLASQGMTFTQAYAMPMCSPTRTTLMTGYNSPRHGITVHLNAYNTIDNKSFSVKTHRGPNNWRYHGMDGSDVTLPQLLGAAGYRTIHCGKAHFGCSGEFAANPTAIGFDINIAGTHKGSPTSYTGNYGNNLPGLDEYENKGIFLTDALTRALNSKIEQAVADGVPFFGYMSYYACHTPFTLNPDATNDYSNAVSDNHKKFATMVEGVDRSIGDILAKLNDLGVAEDTLIVFLGDNGSDSPALTDEAYSVGSKFRDFPIRGKKGSAYEGGTRVPLIIAWAAPKSSNSFQRACPITSGGVEHDIVAVEDIAPTILAASGVTAPKMDGYDLAPYLRSEGGSHRPQRLIRHMPHEHRSNYFTWCREAEWKLVYRFDSNAFELYNLAENPDESNDLASDQPGRVLSMARTMARELDDSWGVYGKLWPTFNPQKVEKPGRPLEDDPFVIDFSVDGRDQIDSDGDGLMDAEEDLDGDGLVGAAESDPDDADTDQDGTDDYTELRLGLDPRNPDESFRAWFSKISLMSMTLTWPSAPGTVFNVLSTTNLAVDSRAWTVISNISAEISSETNFEFEPSAPAEFYKIELQKYPF